MHLERLGHPAADAQLCSSRGRISCGRYQNDTDPWTGLGSYGGRTRRWIHSRHEIIQKHDFYSVVILFENLQPALTVGRLQYRNVTHPGEHLDESPKFR